MNDEIKFEVNSERDTPLKLNCDIPENIIPNEIDSNEGMYSIDTDEISDTNMDHYMTTPVTIEGKTIDGYAAPGLDTSPLGNLKVTIKGDPDLVAWSEANQNWHIKSGRDSYLPLTLEATNITGKDGMYFMRLTLVRRNQKYQELKVDTLCDKHAIPGDPEDKLRTIQKVADNDNNYWYTSGIQRSLCAGCPWPKEGNIKREITVKLICMDTCHNSSKPSKLRERARDLLLVATLEHKSYPGNEISIIARNAIPIWPKNRIAKRELLKKERRLPKGQKKGVKKERNNKPILQRVDWVGFDWLCNTTITLGQAIGLNNSEILTRFEKWQESNQGIQDPNKNNQDPDPSPGSINEHDYIQNTTSTEMEST